MGFLHPLLPLFMHPDMTSAAGTATTALADDAHDTVVHRYIHHMIANGALMGFTAAVGLHEGDTDGVLK